MKMTRRFFIGGAASFGAFGAFGGCRFFNCGSSFRAGDAPRLKFGVLSDVHILDAGSKRCNLPTLVHAFKCFRDDGVDAVMICGDISDHGLVSDLNAVGEAWRTVFPGNRAPDGRKVEKLFVTGNHDWEGHLYGEYVKKTYPNKADYDRAVMRTDYAGAWERAFDEPYAPVWMKDVKGYKFVGAHWIEGRCRGKNENFNSGVREFYARHARDFDPSLPFFHAQHPHPKDTCYGSWAWGRDVGDTTAAFSSMPNAVTFSGHSHYTLTDERSIWQGEFTSIGAGSLLFTGLPDNSRQEDGGYENTAPDAGKVMPVINRWNTKQGMLVSVWDDSISISRREFVTDQSLGPDWVMPLPSAEPKPFDFKRRAAASTAPEFPAGATVAVARTKAKTRKTKKADPVEKDAYEFTFPAAVSSVAARVHEYELSFVSGSDRKKRYVIAPGFNQPIGDKRNSAPVKCTIATDRLPAAPFTVEVRPLSCWLKAGKPIVAKVS